MTNKFDGEITFTKNINGQTVQIHKHFDNVEDFFKFADRIGNNDFKEKNTDRLEDVKGFSKEIFNGIKEIGKNEDFKEMKNDFFTMTNSLKDKVIKEGWKAVKVIKDKTGIDQSNIDVYKEKLNWYKQDLQNKINEIRSNNVKSNLENILLELSTLKNEFTQIGDNEKIKEINIQISKIKEEIKSFYSK